MLQSSSSFEVKQLDYDALCDAYAKQKLLKKKLHDERHVLLQEIQMLREESVRQQQASEIEEESVANRLIRKVEREEKTVRHYQQQVAEEEASREMLSGMLRNALREQTNMENQLEAGQELFLMTLQRRMMDVARTNHSLERELLREQKRYLALLSQQLLLQAQPQPSNGEEADEAGGTPDGASGAMGSGLAVQPTSSGVGKAPVEGAKDRQCGSPPPPRTSGESQPSHESESTPMVVRPDEPKITAESLEEREPAGAGGLLDDDVAEGQATPVGSRTASHHTNRPSSVVSGVANAMPAAHTLLVSSASLSQLMSDQQTPRPRPRPSPPNPASEMIVCSDNNMSDADDLSSPLLFSEQNGSFLNALRDRIHQLIAQNEAQEKRGKEYEECFAALTQQFYTAQEAVMRERENAEKLRKDLKMLHHRLSDLRIGSSSSRGAGGLYANGLQEDSTVTTPESLSLAQTPIIQPRHLNDLDASSGNLFRLQAALGRSDDYTLDMSMESDGGMLSEGAYQRSARHHT